MVDKFFIVILYMPLKKYKYATRKFRPNEKIYRIDENTDYDDEDTIVTVRKNKDRFTLQKKTSPTSQKKSPPQSQTQSKTKKWFSSLFSIKKGGKRRTRKRKRSTN